MGRPEPKCPVRPGDPCSLCWPGAAGPADCGLVWLVRNDDPIEDDDEPADASSGASEPTDGDADGGTGVDRPRLVG